MNETLIFPIKKKWYDMILSGEKKEEYREIKTYYTSRFISHGLIAKTSDGETICLGPEFVVFRNGYSSTSPACLALVYVMEGTGNPEWGAEKDKEYYVLKIVKVRELIKEEIAEKKYYVCFPNNTRQDDTAAKMVRKIISMMPQQQSKDETVEIAIPLKELGSKKDVSYLFGSHRQYVSYAYTYILSHGGLISWHMNGESGETLMLIRDVALESTTDTLYVALDSRARDFENIIGGAKVVI